MIKAQFKNPRRYERFIMSLALLDKELTKRLNVLLYDLVEETANRLRDAIKNNEPDLIGVKRFRAISRSWVNEKRSRGWNTTPLNRTMSYANSIFTTHTGDVHTITVPSTTYDDGERSYKFTYKDLARWLEHGTRNHRPIKHWSHAKRNMMKQFRVAMVQEVENALFKR
jgi:hypothetical protein